MDGRRWMDGWDEVFEGATCEEPHAHTLLYHPASKKFPLEIIFLPCRCNVSDTKLLKREQDSILKWTFVRDAYLWLDCNTISKLAGILNLHFITQTKNIVLLQISRLISIGASSPKKRETECRPSRFMGSRAEIFNRSRLHVLDSPKPGTPFPW